MAKPASNRQPPNIIVIMSDEHDPGVTGAYGDPIVETPNLDRLAAEGITFDACYTTSPLCVPARLSFTAGKYISRIGAWSNDCWLPTSDYPSLPLVLQSAGYQTFLCGKQHYDRTRRYGFTDILPEIWSNNAFKTGHGVRRDPTSAAPEAGRRGWKSRSQDFYPAEESRIMAHDRLVTERTCAFLRNWRESQQPFMLFVGHLAPHFPLIAPQTIYDKYQGRVPMPEVPEGLLASQPANYQQLRYGFGIHDTEPELVRKGRELYWALVDWYDGQIGQIMETLHASGVANNTMVLYTSDHGENKGDHGLWWKNNMYEHASRIPLISWWPERWAGGQRRGGVCSLVDIVQTISHTAGASTPEDWDGDSLLPILDNPDEPWKDYAVSEYYGHNVASGMTMLRNGSWKYIYHSRASDDFGPEVELYQLAQDPQELNNLAARPDQAGRLDQMHRQLVAELGTEPDELEARCRSDFAATYGRDQDS
jgi:choline-sulfatase